MSTPEASRAQQLADAVGREFYAHDAAVQAMGMTLTAIGPGRAEFAMTVRDDMLNSHGTCHGGLIFTLADTAFAYACNAHNRRCVAQSCSITFLAPAPAGSRLIARCNAVASAGRSGIYDTTVTDDDGTTIALFRGQSREVKGTILDAEPDPTPEGGSS